MVFALITPNLLIGAIKVIQYAIFGIIELPFVLLLVFMNLIIFHKYNSLEFNAALNTMFSPAFAVIFLLSCL